MSWEDEAIGLAAQGGALTCADSQLVLLFSGRLINQRELSLDLRQPESAGAVNILRAYRRWGDDFLRHLLGDFALALWDGHDRRLLLARDVAGYRPLHYCIVGGKLRFASQARELLAHGDVRLAADEGKVAHWLSRIPDVPGTTFFRGISCVPPGYSAVWQNGRVTLGDFWRPSCSSELRLADSREYADGLLSVLDQAVGDRLRPFTMAGSHLSGGLDSSSVTASAASILQQRGGTVAAFTVIPSVAVDEARFSGRFCDESAHASATAALYPNVQHIFIPTVSGTLFDSLDRMSSASECPQLNPGNSCWFYEICAEAARRGLPVMLTGASGNFTISYDGRRALSTLLRTGRIPSLLKLALAQHRRGSTWRSMVQLASRPLMSSRTRRALDLLCGRQSLKVEDATGMRSEFAARSGLDAQGALDCAEGLDGKSLRLWCLRRNDFGGHIAALLKLTGVEQMDPTCDRRVTEFCLSVPEEHYRRDGFGRSLLRDAMARRLPTKVLAERRIGRQSADLVYHLMHERAEIHAELQRLKKVDLAVRSLDLEELQLLVDRWPSPPFGRSEHDQYGTRLMRAISMGRFIRRLEEGTLFRDELPARSEAPPVARQFRPVS